MPVCFAKEVRWQKVKVQLRALHISLSCFSLSSPSLSGSLISTHCVTLLLSEQTKIKPVEAFLHTSFISPSSCTGVMDHGKGGCGLTSLSSCCPRVYWCISCWSNKLQQEKIIDSVLMLSFQRNAGWSKRSRIVSTPTDQLVWIGIHWSVLIVQTAPVGNKGQEVCIFCADDHRLVATQHAAEEDGELPVQRWIPSLLIRPFSWLKRKNHITHFALAFTFLLVCAHTGCTLLHTLLGVSHTCCCVSLGCFENVWFELFQQRAEKSQTNLQPRKKEAGFFFSTYFFTLTDSISRSVGISEATRHEISPIRGFQRQSIFENSGDMWSCDFLLPWTHCSVMGRLLDELMILKTNWLNDSFVHLLWMIHLMVNSENGFIPDACCVLLFRFADGCRGWEEALPFR